LEALLAKLAGTSEFIKIILLGTSTLLSEDLTTIFSGMMISQGSLHVLTGILGCFLGIFIGDGLLYAVGFAIGRPALKLPVLRNILPEEKVDSCARWFEKNGLSVIFASRFLPGTRLPTYFAAGLVGAKARFFLLASGIAVAIWVPLLIYISYLFGEQLVEIMETHERWRWPVMIGGMLFIFGLVRFSLYMGDWKVRKRIASRLRRFTRWEFWPLPVFYAPVVLYNFWLALKHRRLALPLISNPGITNSGYIGESKSEVLRSFAPSEFISNYTEIAPGNLEHRVLAIQAWMNETKIAFPIMLKPEWGQRGDGVRRVTDETALRSYLSDCPVAVQAQEFAEGPYEFGVFYRRFPDQEHGQILGLTGKEFPQVVGDGKQTLETLILRHKDVLGRSHIFLERFKDRRQEILLEGECQALVSTGNHCLGTLFVDSTYLKTKELEERFDAISHSFPGFFIGRYDVRAKDLEGFRNGTAFKIIELNGAASEPGHMYDTRHGLAYAWKTMFAMYRDIWEIGRQNEAAGAGAVSLRDLYHASRQYRDLERQHPENRD